MKKALIAVVVLIAAGFWWNLTTETVSAARIENGMYKQSFYFLDFAGNKTLIANTYVSMDEQTKYSIAYDRNGKETKYADDDGVAVAYSEWIENQQVDKLHYFSALRYDKDGGRYIQRVGVNIDQKAYALFYKCIDSDEATEYDADYIAASNTFGYRRRLYKKYDTIIYEWVAQEGDDREEILSQLGPNSLDELDPNKATTKAPETTTVQPTEETTVAPKPVAPAKPTIKSVKKKKSAKKITISIKKVANANGYNIQIAKKKNFRTVLFKKFTSKLNYSLTNSKLKNIAVFVRVRAYVLVDGEKKYGKWSTVKKSK